MKKSRYIPAILIALTLLTSACEGRKKSGESTQDFPRSITVQDHRFVDNYGRHTILNGINVVNKNPEENYLPQEGKALYGRLRDWGFNSIRFGAIWDGLEPEMGNYDQAYLEALDQHIQWAGEHGLFVVLDMHQDLFSVRYADGAPEWATLSNRQEHITGDVWSDAYLISPAVQTAFDNFWANVPIEKIGLQDRYAQAWQHLAKRYADNPTVIGYDLMNEPFPGSTAQQAIPALLEAYGKIIYQRSGQMPSEAELMAVLEQPEQRAAALEQLSGTDSFGQFIDALHPLTHRFETERLQPFYQKVADAIRKVDSSSVLFLEHTYFGNMGVASSIARTTLPNGKPDPLVAYAPHAYDLVTDTDNAAASSQERINFIFNRIEETGARLQMPVWLGEWGAYYTHDKHIIPVAQHAIQQLEKRQMGNAYWSYQTHIEKQSYFKEAIIRPYPLYVSGTLLSYKHTAEEGKFTVQWDNSKAIAAPTVIYLPNLGAWQLNTLPKSYKTLAISGTASGYVIIPNSKKDETVTVTLEHISN